jgi:flavin-dependent dehydrogenase
VAHRLADACDVVVVGGGPAGAAAAIRARQLGLSVAVIEKEPFPRPRACGGWIGPAGVKLIESLGVTARRAGATAFRGLMLHSWDLKRSAEADEAALSGWLVERGPFDQSLLKAATDAGAQVRHAATVESLALGDQHVTLRLADGLSLRAGILIIADGADSRTAELAGLRPAAHLGQAAHAVFAECLAGKPDALLHVIIGGGRGGRLAAIVRAGRHVRLSLFTRDTERDPAEQFGRMARSAIEAGLVPPTMPTEAPARPTPAGVALDMDTHVGKRTLLTGDAGGFVAAFSNEGVYPAMESGRLAAEAAGRALRAALPQDALADYEDAWRGGLAEYLRMPHTDLSLLTPLVFNNRQMTLRVARAFLLGQSF